MVLYLYAVFMYTIIKDKGTEKEKAHGLHLPNGEEKMRITIKHEGKIKCTHYRASEGCESVIVSVYDWPLYNKVHIVAYAYGSAPLSFFAESFSAENAVDLLKVYAKAYI